MSRINLDILTAFQHSASYSAVFLFGQARPAFLPWAPSFIGSGSLFRPLRFHFWPLQELLGSGVSGGFALAAEPVDCPAQEAPKGIMEPLNK